MTDPLPSIKRVLLSPADLLDDIRLNLVDGIGPLLTERLLERFGTSTAVWEASHLGLTEVAGIGPTLVRAIDLERKSGRAEQAVRLCEKNGITILSRRDSRYPSSLLELPDPPVLLYIRGTIEPVDALSLAVVGTRGISWYGRKMTRLLTTALVQAGFTIVSGLARGVDGHAHQATLDAGGRTLAVLGSGLLRIFPQEHTELAAKIAENGAVISEFPPEMEPSKGNFPRRNRVVSGLSLGTLVIESPRKGGALITARHAMEQNREVFAVPGPVDQENSRGCHQLLKDGAKLVETVDDILESLSPLAQPVVHPDKESPILNPRELALNEREQKIIGLITSRPRSIDLIIEESGLPAAQVIGVISVLEMRRLVRRAEGNTVYRQ